METPFYDFVLENNFFTQIEKFILALKLWLFDILKKIGIYFKNGFTNFLDFFIKNNYFDFIYNNFDLELKEEKNIKIYKMSKMVINYISSFIMTILKNAEEKEKIFQKVKKIKENLLFKTQMSEKSYYENIDILKKNIKHKGKNNIFKAIIIANNFLTNSLQKYEVNILKDFEILVSNKKVKKEVKKKFEDIIFDNLKKIYLGNEKRILKDEIKKNLLIDLMNCLEKEKNKKKKKLKIRIREFIISLTDRPSLLKKLIEVNFEFKLFWKSFNGEEEEEFEIPKQKTKKKIIKPYLSKKEKNFKSEDYLLKKIEKTINIDKECKKMKNKKSIEYSLKKIKKDFNFRKKEIKKIFNFQKNENNSIFKLNMVKLTLQTENLDVELLTGNKPISFSFLPDFQIYLKLEKRQNFTDISKEISKQLKEKFSNKKNYNIITGWIKNTSILKNEGFKKKLKELKKDEFYREVCLIGSIGFEMYILRYSDLNYEIKKYINYSLEKNQRVINFHKIFVFIMKRNKYKGEEIKGDIKEFGRYEVENSFCGEVGKLDIEGCEDFESFFTAESLEDPNVTFE